MFGIPGPKLKGTILRKTGTRKGALIIPRDQRHSSRQTTSKSYTETRLRTMSCFFLRAPFGQYGPVAALYWALVCVPRHDSHPGPGGSRTAASCQRQARRPSAIPLQHGAGSPAHNELLAPMNEFMRRQFANQEPLRTNLLIPALEYRIAQAAKLRGAHAQMVHAISRNFSIRDTNQIMEQLIHRCQGNLDQYIRDEMLMHNHCMEIVRSLNLTMLETMLSVDD